jgi:hypothetical protein
VQIILEALLALGIDPNLVFVKMLELNNFIRINARGKDVRHNFPSVSKWLVAQW